MDCRKRGEILKEGAKRATEELHKGKGRRPELPSASQANTDVKKEGAGGGKN